MAGNNLSRQQCSLAAGVGLNNSKLEGLAGILQQPAANLLGWPRRRWLCQTAGDHPSQQQHIVREVKDPLGGRGQQFSRAAAGEWLEHQPIEPAGRYNFWAHRRQVQAAVGVATGDQAFEYHGSGGREQGWNWR